MRIAAIGLNHETNTFSPWPTAYSDFIIRRGPDMLQGEFWDAWRGRGSC